MVSKGRDLTWVSLRSSSDRPTIRLGVQTWVGRGGVCVILRVCDTTLVCEVGMGVVVGCSAQLLTGFEGGRVGRWVTGEGVCSCVLVVLPSLALTGIPSLPLGLG